MRFFIVGILSALLNFSLSIFFSGLGLRPILSFSMAYTIVFFITYFVHISWTFKSSMSKLRAIHRYFFAQMAVFISGGVASEILITYCGLRKSLGFIVSFVFSGLLAYHISKVWVFRGKV